MAGRVIISGGRIANCGTGIELGDNNAHVEISDVTIEHCTTAILQRDSASALAALGIPSGVSHQDLREVIELLLSDRYISSDDRERAVKSSRFWSAVQNSANAATIIQGLIALAPATLAVFKSLL